MSNQIIDQEGKIITNRVIDPHHGGSSEWGFYDGSFWHRTRCHKTWTRVKKVSLTPSRLKALITLIDKNYCNDQTRIDSTSQ